MSNKNLAFVITLNLFVVGCGLSDKTIQEAARMPKVLDQASKTLASERAAYDSLLGSLPIPNIREIANREKLTDGFGIAEGHIKKLREIVTALDALVKADRGRDEEEAGKKIRLCLQLARFAGDEVTKPRQHLEKWKKIFETSDAERAEAEQTAAGADKLVTDNLSDTSALMVSIRAKQAKYPNKQSDLNERVRGILSSQTRLHEELKAVQEQADALHGQGTGSPDIARFEDALDAVDEAADEIDDRIDDLTEKLNELDESYELVLLRLEKIPSFWLHYSHYEWTDSDWDDTRETDLGWRDVSQNAYFGEAERITESTGSDWYYGSETWLDDKEIRYEYYATTAEKNSGKLGQETRAPIGEEVFDDYFESAQKLNQVFADARPIVNQTVSTVLDDDDGQPVAMDIRTNLVLEQKLVGQYEDETSETPTVSGVPLGLVGNSEYGAWQKDNQGRDHWQWHNHGHSDFWLGYWFGGMRSPYWYIGRDYYDNYDSWRRNSGYRRYEEEDGYRRGYFRGGTVRGAGREARARGLGGGGK